MVETIAVPKELLQILFDTAVGSMDFGSGFLDDEEVFALRQTAELLGVDPMTATPETYRKRMIHAFEAKPRNPSWAVPLDPDWRPHCKWCDHFADDEIHAEEVGG